MRVAFPTTPVATIRFCPEGSGAPVSSTVSGGATVKDPAPTFFPGDASPAQLQFEPSFKIAYSAPAWAA